MGGEDESGERGLQPRRLDAALVEMAPARHHVDEADDLAAEDDGKVEQGGVTGSGGVVVIRQPFANRVPVIGDDGPLLDKEFAKPARPLDKIRLARRKLI